MCFAKKIYCGRRILRWRLIQRSLERLHEASRCRLPEALGLKFRRTSKEALSGLRFWSASVCKAPNLGAVLEALEYSQMLREGQNRRLLPAEAGLWRRAFQTFIANFISAPRCDAQRRLGA